MHKTLLPKVKNQSFTSKSITTPSSVDPGSQTAGIVVPDSSMSGTRGVVRWNIGGSLNRVLSVMWSVPYNRQFWRQWVAVGLSSSSDLPR